MMYGLGVCELKIGGTGLCREIQFFNSHGAITTRALAAPGTTARRFFAATNPTAYATAGQAVYFAAKAKPATSPMAATNRQLCGAPGGPRGYPACRSSSHICSRWKSVKAIAATATSL